MSVARGEAEVRGASVQDDAIDPDRGHRRICSHRHRASVLNFASTSRACRRCGARSSMLRRFRDAHASRLQRSVDWSSGADSDRIRAIEVDRRQLAMRDVDAGSRRCMCRASTPRSAHAVEARRARAWPAREHTLNAVTALSVAWLNRHCSAASADRCTIGRRSRYRRVESGPIAPGLRSASVQSRCRRMIVEACQCATCIALSASDNGITDRSAQRLPVRRRRNQRRRDDADLAR